MNIPLKKFIFISAAIHFFVLFPIITIQTLVNDTRNNVLTVDYVRIAEASDLSLEKTVAKNADKQNSNIVLSKDAPKEGKEVKKDDDRADIDNSTIKNKTEKAYEKKVAQIKGTKDYSNYYDSIREKIRSKLKENYKYYYNEGDVYLIFSLRSDGTLMTHNIDSNRSSSDDTLHRIATVSLIESAPFSEFPKAMALPKMTFNLVVSFKRQ